MIRLALAGVRHRAACTWGCCSGSPAGGARWAACHGRCAACGPGLSGGRRLGPVAVVVEASHPFAWARGCRGFRHQVRRAGGGSTASPRPMTAAPACVCWGQCAADGAGGHRVRAEPAKCGHPARAGRRGTDAERLVVVRVGREEVAERPAITREEGHIVPLRLALGAPLPDAWPAGFALDADPLRPPVGLVDLTWIGEARGGRHGQPPVGGKVVNRVRAAVVRRWSWRDAGVTIDTHGDEVILSTIEVLLPPPVERAAIAAVDGATPTLTWFVDHLSTPGHTSNYAFVTALPSATDGLSPQASLVRALPDVLEDDEIVLTSWVAEDLEVAAGDTITLRYPVVGRGRSVRHETSPFRVRAVVAPDDVTADAGWTPPIEGLSDRATCSEWIGPAGRPVPDRSPRRGLWSEYGPAPKAWGVAAGRRIWGGPHGRVTSVRYPPGTEVAEVAKASCCGCGRRCRGARAGRRPAAVGDRGARQRLRRPVPRVSVCPTGLCALADALLFSFTLERRGGELGALRATGWSRGAVQGLFLTEGIIVAAAGMEQGCWRLLYGACSRACPACGPPPSGWSCLCVRGAHHGCRRHRRPVCGDGGVEVDLPRAAGTGPAPS